MFCILHLRCCWIRDLKICVDDDVDLYILRIFNAGLPFSPSLIFSPAMYTLFSTLHREIRIFDAEFLRPFFDFLIFIPPFLKPIPHSSYRCHFEFTATSLDRRYCRSTLIAFVFMHLSSWNVVIAVSSLWNSFQQAGFWEISIVFLLFLFSPFSTPPMFRSSLSNPQDVY